MPNVFKLKYIDQFNNGAVCFETVTLLKVNTIYLEGLYFATDSAFNTQLIIERNKINSVQAI